MRSAEEEGEARDRGEEISPATLINGWSIHAWLQILQEGASWCWVSIFYCCEYPSKPSLPGFNPLPPMRSLLIPRQLHLFSSLGSMCQSSPHYRCWQTSSVSEWIAESVMCCWRSLLHWTRQTLMTGVPYLCLRSKQRCCQQYSAT